MSKIVMLLILLGISASCSRTVSQGVSGESSLFVELEKGPCFGFCPEYLLRIYSDGTAYYEGIRSVDKVGIFQKTLDDEVMDRIADLINECEFFNQDDHIMNQIADAPYTYLTVNENGVSHRIGTNIAFPEKVIELENFLISVSDSDNWKSLADMNPDHPGQISNEIIISLRANATPESLLSQFANYGLEVVERITQNHNYWLFRYDTAAIKPEQIIREIRLHAGVQAAEFNKEIRLRKR